MKNRIRPYLYSSITATVIASILSFLFDFSLKNTWQASVALFFICGPLWFFAWKETEFLNDKMFIFRGFIKFFLGAALIIYVIASVLVFLGFQF